MGGCQGHGLAFTVLALGQGHVMKLIQDTAVSGQPPAPFKCIDISWD